MSSSQDFNQFLADLDPGAEWTKAEAYVAQQLDLDLDKGEHLGAEWVLTPDENILAGCQRIIDTAPNPDVLIVVVAALRGSYHLQKVHALINEIARAAAERWLSGNRGRADRRLLHEIAHAYRYGTRQADLDFVLSMCSDPSFGPEHPGDGHDFRIYWFASMAKIKDPRVGEFCRDLIKSDLGKWTDFRLVESMRIVVKRWEPADAALLKQVAADHPEAWIRREAERLIKRGSAGK